MSLGCVTWWEIWHHMLVEEARTKLVEEGGGRQGTVMVSSFQMGENGGSGQRETRAPGRMLGVGEA